MNKKYQTRDGHEVRIYAIDGGGAYTVQGAIKRGEIWIQLNWKYDPIEVKSYFWTAVVRTISLKSVWVTPMTFKTEEAVESYVQRTHNLELIRTMKVEY